MIELAEVGLWTSMWSWKRGRRDGITHGTEVLAIYQPMNNPRRELLTPFLLSLTKLSPSLVQLRQVDLVGEFRRLLSTGDQLGKWSATPNIVNVC